MESYIIYTQCDTSEETGRGLTAAEGMMLPTLQPGLPLQGTAFNTAHWRTFCAPKLEQPSW